MAYTEQANGAALYYNADFGRIEQHIFFLGEDGSLNQSWYDQNVWDSQRLPGNPVTWPIAMPFYGNQYPELHVFFVDASGGVGHTFWGLVGDGGGWSTEVLPGNPVGNLAAGNLGFEKHVFYVEADGALHQTFNGPAVGWTAQRLPGSPANNLPFGLSTLDWSLGGYPIEQHVFYLENGQLAQSWWDGTNWNRQSLPGTPAGIPASIVTYDGLLQHVYFVATDGSLQQSWFDGTNWNNQSLPGSQLGEWVQAGEYRNPSTGVNEQHAFYVDTNGQLGQSWWDGQNWNQQQLPGTPSRLLGVGNYYPTRRNTKPEQHIFFRANDGSLQQSWYDGNGWNNQPLPIATALDPGFGF